MHAEDAVRFGQKSCSELEGTTPKENKSGRIISGDARLSLARVSSFLFFGGNRIKSIRDENQNCLSFARLVAIKKRAHSTADHLD